jgi:upstream activation factor subunit UAF30
MSRKTAAVTVAEKVPVVQDEAQLAIAIPPAARHPKVRMITRSQIHPDPEQPRAFPDAELRDSIARNGLLQPITVRPHPTIMTEWMIVDGERRWRGTEGVLEDLACIVRMDMDELSRRLATQLEANTGKPLEPLEEARALGRLVEDTGMPVGDLADFLGRPKSTVAERLALLELGPWLALIEAGELPMSHAVKVLLPLRAVPDTFHEKAIKGIQGDYRWTHKGEGRGISLGDFERLVNRYYRAAMYPLVKTKGYGKQPEFTTSKHDAECGCGTIKFDLTGSGTTRVCCCNPGWWGPLHRAAKKAKKPAGGKSSTPKGKTLYLPAGAKTVKSSYGSAPSGVVQLTDTNGDWNVHNLSEPFDPADLSIDASKLVTWKPDYGSGYQYVGTMDLAAVKAARATWAARWAEELKKLRGELAAAIRDHRKKYEMVGEGAPYIVGLAGRETAQTLLDIAHARAIDVPASIYKGSSWELDTRVRKWAGALSAVDAAELLTGLATIAGEELVLPAERLAQLERKTLDGIRKRPIPWKTKPKEAPAKKSVAKKAAAKKGAGKKVPAKTSRTSRVGDFMKPMYPSTALAAIVGAQPIVRTEVTKKLWSYIKRHKLQDTKNRRNINADEKLRAVFGGKDQASMFEMTKMVNKHLAGTSEAAALIFTSKKGGKNEKSDRATARVEVEQEVADLRTAAASVDEDHIDDDIDDDDDMDGPVFVGVPGTDDQDLWDSEDED